MDVEGNCVQIELKYVDDKLFTAKRPPVEETSSFLQSLLASHGPNYLEKLFGAKARDALGPLGGVDKVAIALSGNSTRICISSSSIFSLPNYCLWLYYTR